MKKETYILSPNLKWSTFKTLYYAIPDDGPTPMQLPKVLWNLMRERRIIIGLNTEINDFIFWTKNPPKGLKVITNGKKA